MVLISMKKTSRKYKRGERGSLQEEANVSKRSNMADCVEEVPIATAAATQPEPNLMDIKEMLVDIQITVATILRENQELRQEILELKSALNANQREMEKLKMPLTKAENANDTLRNELNLTRMKLKYQIEEMNNLDEKYDDLEQYSCKNSLKILGVPKGTYTSTDEAIIRIGGVINIHIKSEDIEILHKLKRKTTKSIIVMFMSHKVKSLLYKVRTKLKNVKALDIFPNHGFASWEDQQCIFINENLTNYRRELFWKANKLKKDNMITSTWTMDGKIFVKMSPNGALVRIYSEEDLDDL